MSRVCGGCGLPNGDKYKCAACKTFKYCSVPCYKSHQENTCTKATTKVNANDSNSGASAASASAASSSAAASPAAAAAIPKSEQPTVSDADLDALARDPLILGALSSSELQSILRLIDRGGVGEGQPAASDPDRMAMLEKYRRTNTDFEQFIQNTLKVINREG